MLTLPSPSYEDLLRQLPVCTNTLQNILDSQPVFATQLAAALRQALGELLPDQPLNPDAVFLNEYMYVGPSKALHFTRSHTLTQVLQKAIVTGTPPTQLAKATQADATNPAMGFYHSAWGAGQEGEIAALEVDAFEALIDDIRQNSLKAYQRKLQVFWTSPHPLTGALSVHDAVSQQQQREILRIEADLKLVMAQQQDKDADLTLLIEGRQLIENQLLHETSGIAIPPHVFGISLFDPQTPAWSVPINGVFILTEKLHSIRPTVLYTPQYGGEAFENFVIMQNTLRKRLVTASQRSLLLTNLPVSERVRANDVLKGGQHLRFTDITGPVFSHCLHGQRNQQQADIAQAFGASHTTFEALSIALQDALRLPLSVNKTLMDCLPAPLDPMSQIPTPHSPPDRERQKHLIRLWDSLNEQIGNVVDKGKHPSLDSVLSAVLKETFTQLPTGVHSNALHVNRYRTDSAGMRHIESSLPLYKALLQQLITAHPTVDEAPDNTVAYAVFTSPSVTAEAEQIAWGGTLQELAETLQRRLPTQVTTYWQTPTAPGLPCPQARLIDLHRKGLDVQARLRYIDNTLSPAAKLLIEHALHHTTQARREASFDHGKRPGVYHLTLDTASPQGQRLAACFVLTPVDGAMSTLPHWPYGHKNLSTQGIGGSTVHGPVVLYTPDQGFEEFPTLQTLHTSLTARIDSGNETGRLLGCTLPVWQVQNQTGLWGNRLRNIFMPIEGDFVAEGVQSLLDKQLDDIQFLLGDADSWSEADFKPACGIADVELNGRDELLELLDMSAAFMVRNQLLLEHYRTDWEKNLSKADEARLQSHAQLALDKQLALGKLWTTMPTLAEYAKSRIMDKINGLPQIKSAVSEVREGCAMPTPNVDPDRSVVIRTSHTRVIAPGGGFGTSHSSAESTRMSLTELILKNTKPWEMSLNWSASDVLNATLADSTGKWVRNADGKPITLKKEVLEQWLKDLNVGPNYIDSVLKRSLYPAAMTRESQALKDAWIAAQAATLNYAATTAKLDPDAYSTPLANDTSQKKAAAWVSAVLAAPDPQTRAAVDNQTVTANALMFNPANNAPEGRGGQTVNGVLLITTGGDEPMVLYAPDAPDGQLLREIKNLSAMAKLTQTSAWQAYLAARLPANTRLLNPRLAPHTGDFLAGLYRQNHMHLAQQVDDQTTSNEELERISTTNKVWFGVEVALTALGATPGPGKYASDAVKWIARMGRITLHTFRKLGRSIPGLIARRGFAGRIIVEMAPASETLTGAARTAGINLRPLPHILKAQTRAATSMNPAILQGYQREFQRRVASLAVPGGIPAGSSLSEGTGIYRAPGSLLVRSTQGSGKEVVLRIQDSFNLYDRNGAVARVLTPSGATTPFRLRQVTNTQRWVLDTLERLPGGMPPSNSSRAVEINDALRQWQTYYETFRAQNPGQTLAIKPGVFFAERGLLYSTWSKYVKTGGELSPRGLERLSAGAGAPFTDDAFMRWVDEPNKSALTAGAFRDSHNIQLIQWERYLHANGSLNASGLTRYEHLLTLRITGTRRRRVTDEHLKLWYEKFLDPNNRNKAAVAHFAFQNNINLMTFYRYVRPNGAFKPLLKTRLERLNIPFIDVPMPLPGSSTAPL
ncbi:dermonecrotic toxin domain-containing protein [Pseudomonas trivialis]|uniref:Dermonecrotic toxin N-terminal domain-containing protein n=1 Tax=Pseudomonas trivialis TaxID=200450 RepID=A0A0H5A540_9PSED|nr:DUF6543 domain-containing protein [Pseudomonas trivialis]AKS06144.1 hypothetical protein AA957_08505 [Pseudomonas trivialis]